jgi:hypothetical protein
LAPGRRAENSGSSRKLRSLPILYFERLCRFDGDLFRSRGGVESAHKIDATDDPIARGLGDSYAEAGRLTDAIAMYNALKNKNSLWNYRVAGSGIIKICMMMR